MNVVIPPKITGLEFCAGIGMLGESVRAALRFLGYQYQTVCYVEREAAAASQLVTLMEAGAIDPAPIWSDLLTFAGRRWRGIVDLLIAGFPCQDISLAGKGRGLDGDRSGLIFDILDDADDCGATGLFLENVAAIASANATVMDEAEEVIERAASRVLGELADRGWHSEWITISASDVGASHGRARWFCLAWRNVADTSSSGLEIGLRQPRQTERPATDERGTGLFAPGPQCDRWSAIVAHHPHLAPATEPRIRVLADGLALVVDESRNHQLRQAGNGVVALQAATAFVVLARRAGLFQ